MSRKKRSPSRETANPIATGRTRALPEGIVSGFRRLAGFPDAALASTLAPLLDPGADGPLSSTDVPRLSVRQAGALSRLDAFAGDVPAGKSLDDALRRRADEPVAFLLALDVDDPVNRWRAVVSRAFARADAVAWCLAEGFEDDAALVAWADRTEQALDSIEPEWRARTKEGTRSGAWGEATGRFDVAWRRRYALSADEHDVMREELGDTLSVLAQRAHMARQCAAATVAGGRTPALARTHFALSLAIAFTLLTGDDVPLSGGDNGNRDAVGTRRKHLPNRWYDFGEAAFDLVGIGTETSLDAILRAAAQTPHVFKVKGMGREPTAREDRTIWQWADLPINGLEIDVGCDVKDPPRSRRDAYRGPSLLYRGRSRRG